MRKQAEQILSNHISDSDVRWRGCKEKVIDSMIAFKELNQGQKLPIDSVTKLNWFQKMPLHWRYLYYMFGGIVIGLLLHYVW